MKYISFLPAIIMMCIIFTFSSKNSVESEHTSNGVAYGIINTYDQILHKEYSIEEKEKIADHLDFFVRKTAHALEYLILSLTVAFPLAINGVERKKLFLATVLCCICYASTDEFHQLFVSGRSGRIRDVLIDGTGAVIGTSLFILVRNKLRFINKVQKNNR